MSFQFKDAISEIVQNYVDTDYRMSTVYQFFTIMLTSITPNHRYIYELSQQWEAFVVKKKIIYTMLQRDQIWFISTSKYQNQCVVQLLVNKDAVVTLQENKLQQRLSKIWLSECKYI